jgi:hypothetical protein
MIKDPVRVASMSVLAGLTLALAACDRPNDNRVPSAAPEAIKAAPNTAAQPPLPVKTDVNAAVAEADMKNIAPASPAQADKDGANQDVNVAAQDAVARSPDTASGDEAKKRVVESGTTGGKSDKGGPADELTRSQESAAMPKPGQANDHSVITREK